MCGLTARILTRRQSSYPSPLRRPLTGSFHVFAPRLQMPTWHSPYEHVEDVERLEDYRPGGFHPIQVGDTLRERYRIAHKLGYGSFSTTWLARDEQLGKYVAIKVGTVDSNRTEADIMARLSAPRNAASQGRDLLPPVLDRFDVQGPNGRHPCLITTPARCTLVDAKDPAGLFQLDVARSLVAQLAMAVAHIHDLGYVHGDLHLGNILLQFPSDLSNLSDKELYNKYGPPNPEPISRVDGKPLPPGVPSHAYRPVWLGDASEQVTLAEAKIHLTDFGVSFRPALESRLRSYTPLDIRPPEARFEPTEPLSFPSDIWSLACTAWAILGQRAFQDSFLLGPDDATGDLVDALGPLPAEWWEKWEARSKKFDGDGRPREGRDPWTFDQRFEDGIQGPRREEGMATMGEGEREALFEMVRWMLAFRPDRRPSAQQVLDTAWMRDWAIPDYEKTWR